MDPYGGAPYDQKVMDKVQELQKRGCSGLLRVGARTEFCAGAAAEALGGELDRHCGGRLSGLYQLLLGEADHSTATACALACRPVILLRYT